MIELAEMHEIYVVIQGGCVEYVSTDSTNHCVVVVDLDDYKRARENGGLDEVMRENLAEAIRLPRSNWR